MYQHNLDPVYIETTFTMHGDFVPLTPISIAPRRHETAYIKYAPPNTYVKLVDNTQLDIVTMMTLTEEIHSGKLYDVIKLTKSKYPQRGHLKYILNILLIDYGFKLMSDYLHTLPGSMDVWKRIKSWAGLQIRIMNTKTKYTRKYINQRDTKVWGLSPELRAVKFLYDRLFESKRTDER
jgi:hypothetical protein